MSARFTARQGEYLAFIHAYTTLNRRPPAVADIADYFDVSPPSAQAMVQQLTKKALITKTPGAARSIRLAIDSSELPCMLCSQESIRTPVAEY